MFKRLRQNSTRTLLMALGQELGLVLSKDWENDFNWNELKHDYGVLHDIRMRLDNLEEAVEKQERKKR